MVPLAYYLLLGATLFVVGLVGVVARRSLPALLMSSQLLLTGANLSWVTFARGHGLLDGQIIALLAMAAGAAQAGVGVVLVARLFRSRQHVDAGRLDALKW